MSIARSQMNRQLYNMGGEGIMQVAPQQQAQGEQYRPQAEALSQDPQKAIEVIVQMLVEQGIPLEEAKKIAMQMIQAVAEGGLEDLEDEERVEARFGGRIGYAEGGIGRLVDREQYGFGSFVKSIGKAVSGAVKGVTNAVKSVAKSPIGRIALTIGATMALGPAGLNIGAGMGTFAGAAFRAGLANLAVQAASGQKINFKEALIAGGISGVTAGLTQGTTGQGVDGGYGTDYQGGLESTGQANLTLPGTSTTFAPDPFQAAAAPAASVPTEVASIYPDISGEALYDSGFDFKNTPSVFDTSAQAATTGGPSISSFQPDYSVYDPTDVGGGAVGIENITGKFGQSTGLRFDNPALAGYQDVAGGSPMNILGPGGRLEAIQSNLGQGNYLDALKQVSGAALDYPMTSILGASTLAGTMTPPQAPNPDDYTSPEEYQKAVAEYENLYKQYTANLGNYQSLSLPTGARNPFYAANGGRIGYQMGGIGNIIQDATKQAFFGTPAMMANGGRIGYAFGSVDEGIMAAPQIAQQMGMPVGNPRQNQGGVAELDYRDGGGFVPPIGVKERADDIPAMLSNNEFVFTADAVRNAGKGDPNVGAQKMYALMKRLESGGIA
jgi:hypothetical protein